MAILSTFFGSSTAGTGGVILTVRRPSSYLAEMFSLGRFAGMRSLRWNLE